MLIDANIFLEVLLEQKNADRCEKILKEIEKGRIAYVSFFAVDTILIVLTKDKSKIEKAKLFLQLIFSYKGLKFYKISSKDRFAALQLMKKHKLDYEDALTLQSALSSGCKEILSFDKHFDKVKEIKSIEPS